MPFFSIIIPVYNVAPYLRECLDSVLAQTYTDWEAICVDDGSTDGSGAILDEYAAKDKRIQVIHQKNAGVSVARNAALDVAMGEWIVFTDSDDCLIQDHLSNFAGVRNKADINFTPMRYLYEDGSVKFCKCQDISTVENPQSVYDLCYKLLFSMTGVNLIGYTFNKFIRASIIRGNQVRFVPRLSVSEDEVFIYACLNKAKSVSALADTGYCYKWRNTGLTHSDSKDYMLLYKSFMSVAKESDNDLIRDMIFVRAIETLSCHYSQTRRISVALLLIDQIRDLHFESRVIGRRAVVFKVHRLSRLWAGLLFHVLCKASKIYGFHVKRTR